MPWTIVGQVGIVGLCVVAVLIGWLIPRSVHREQIELWKQRSEDFKTAYEAADARNDKLAESVRQLMTYAETADRILQAWALQPSTRALPSKAGDVL